jgi:hypothetical protein
LQTDHFVHRAVTSLLLACSLATLGATVHAEGHAYTFGARQSFTHDSNVARTISPQSDTISSTGLFAIVDQPLGRERLTGQLSMARNHYNRFERLNNTSVNGFALLDWSTVGRLSGDIRVNHNQGLYSDFSGGASGGRRSTVKTTDGIANMRVGVVTRWTLEGGLSISRTRFDNEELSNSDINYRTVSAGVRYTPSDLMSLGIGGRQTEGEYPHVPTVSGASARSDFDRKDLDLTGSWHPTGRSNFSGRISRSDLHFKSAGTRSNTLTTGELGYQWNPGGRLKLDAHFKRDSTAGLYGLQAGDIASGLPITVETAETRISNIYTGTAHYEITGKIRLQFDVTRIDRKLDNSILTSMASAVQTGSDRTNVERLAATYEVTRSGQLYCSVGRTSRSVKDSSARLTYPYTANQVSCGGQFALQP